MSTLKELAWELSFVEEGKNEMYELRFNGGVIASFSSFMLMQDSHAFYVAVQNAIRRSRILDHYNKYEEHEEKIESIRAFENWRNKPSFIIEDESQVTLASDRIDELRKLEKDIFDFFEINQHMYQAGVNWHARRKQRLKELSK